MNMDKPRWVRGAAKLTAEPVSAKLVTAQLVTAQLVTAKLVVTAEFAHDL